MTSFGLSKIVQFKKLIGQVQNPTLPPAIFSIEVYADNIAILLDSKYVEDRKHRNV